MIENITNRKSAEAELIRQARLSERQALHDPLTDLPNRLLFGDRIERAIIQAGRGATRLGVVMMDLDRFKEVNDSLGHTAETSCSPRWASGCAARCALRTRRRGAG